MIHFQVRHLMGVSWVSPIDRRSNYDRTKKRKKSSVHCYAIPIITGQKKIHASGHHSLRRSNCHCCAVPITTKKKIQSSVRCYAIPITTGKKDTVVWPSFVAPFQLPCCAVPITTGKKKDSVICPLLRHSNYDRKKKVQSSCHHSLRHSNCHCCAVPITTGKKRYSRLSVVTTLQIRPEKKNVEKIIFEKKNFTIYRSCTVPIVVWPSFVAPFQSPWLRCSDYDRKKEKIQSSVRCYAIPITTGKKKIQPSGHLSLRRSNCHCCAIPITTGKKRYSHLSSVMPFQLRPEKKRYSMTWNPVQ